MRILVKFANLLKFFFIGALALCLAACASGTLSPEAVAAEQTRNAELLGTYQANLKFRASEQMELGLPYSTPQLTNSVPSWVETGGGTPPPLQTQGTMPVVATPSFEPNRTPTPTRTAAVTTPTRTTTVQTLTWTATVTTPTQTAAVQTLTRTVTVTTPNRTATLPTPTRTAVLPTQTATVSPGWEGEWTVFLGQEGGPYTTGTLSVKVEGNSLRAQTILDGVSYEFIGEVNQSGQYVLGDYAQDSTAGWFYWTLLSDVQFGGTLDNHIGFCATKGGTQPPDPCVYYLIS
jgi:hypothetical protein